MNMNMGNADRFVRGLIAVCLIALNIKGIVTDGRAFAAIIIAVIFILTSMVGFCPIYSLLGFTSRKINS
jgi:hypothetical protein